MEGDSVWFPAILSLVQTPPSTTPGFTLLVRPHPSSWLMWTMDKKAPENIQRQLQLLISLGHEKVDAVGFWRVLRHVPDLGSQVNHIQDPHDGYPGLTAASTRKRKREETRRLLLPGCQDSRTLGCYRPSRDGSTLPTAATFLFHLDAAVVQVSKPVINSNDD